MPQSSDPTAPASTGADPGNDPVTPEPVAVGPKHPVFGHREPSTAERFAWTAAYSSYSVHAGIEWDNRARDGQSWLAAVNRFSTDPDNWYPTRRHDIGRVHGVSLMALIDRDTFRIEPRHLYLGSARTPYTSRPSVRSTSASSANGSWPNTITPAMNAAASVLLAGRTALATRRCTGRCSRPTNGDRPSTLGASMVACDTVNRTRAVVRRRCSASAVTDHK